MPPGLQSYAGNSDRNHVFVLGGSTRHGFETLENGGSRYGTGRANEGITKKTELSLDTRSDDEARGWFRGNDGHGEQEAFNWV